MFGNILRICGESARKLKQWVESHRCLRGTAGKRRRRVFRKIRIRFKIAADMLAAVRSIAISLVVLCFWCLLVRVVYLECRRNVVLVEPFNVPPELEKLGYGPTVVANQLVDQVKAILWDVRTAKKRREFVTPSTEPAVDVEVPDAHVSVRSMVNYARQYLAGGAVRVSGDVLFGTNTLQLTLRVISSHGDLAQRSSATVTGQIDKVDLLLRRAAEETLKYTDPNFLAGYYLSEERTVEAMEVIRRCLHSESVDNRASAYCLWGLAYVVETNYETATTKFLKALEVKPHYAIALELLGTVSLLQGELSKAVSYYEKAIVEDPKEAMAFRNLGAISMLQTNWEKAAAMSQKATEFDPSDAQA